MVKGLQLVCHLKVKKASMPYLQQSNQSSNSCPKLKSQFDFEIFFAGQTTFNWYFACEYQPSWYKLSLGWCIMFASKKLEIQTSYGQLVMFLGLALEKN